VSQRSVKERYMTHSTTQQTTISLLRKKTVLSIYGKSRSSLYRDINSGLYVKPVKIGLNAVAWPANEVAAINKARIAGKSSGEIKDLVTQLEKMRAA